MRIGELSDLSGFTKETIRYYQKLGFFEGSVKQVENNYRDFSEEAIDILQLIKESKLYGFTLRENLALLKVRHKRILKLALMEQFLDEKTAKNLQTISELTIQNKRLETLKSDIHTCQKQCS